MRKFVVILCLFWMGFIFYMSSNNGEISHQESKKIVNLIKNNIVNLEVKAETKTTNGDSQVDKNTVNEQQVKENNLDYLIRKNAHGFMYMILAFLISSVFFVFDKKGKNVIVYILFISLFYAVTDEFHQSFVVGRTSLVSDVLVDFGGTLIGVAFFYLAYYKRYKITSICKSYNLN